MNARVLFFCRGRGHGHAIPDMAIADEIHAQDPSVVVQFASYSTGASTIRASGRPVIDLALPEGNSYLATLLVCADVIKRERPSLIVAHEEFAALPAARLCGTKSIFLSAWLPPGGNIAAESLSYADGIIIIDNPGIFPVPAGVRTRPCYTGPLIRQMKFTSNDRMRLRAELGWPMQACYVLVVPGGADKEDQIPMSDLVISAFFKLERPEKRLVWVSSNDFRRLNERFSGLRDVEVLPFQDPIERLLAAADVVITKGTRGITYDAAAVGVPSISLSPNNNPIDDMLVPRIRTNIALVRNAVDPDVLALYLAELCTSRELSQRQPAPRSEAAALAAREIRRLLGPLL